MQNKTLSSYNNIQNKIHTIRNVQVMLDNDLAKLYGVEVKVLNQAVRRNIERFPEEFMFQLTKAEYISLRSQFVTLKKDRGTHRKYLPYVFTEQGVAMLSAVLRSKTAVDVSIKIMKAFVGMRKFIIKNAEIFSRLDKLEYKAIEHDKKFDEVFKALESPEELPKQGIFFEGQIFDAYKFVSDLIRKAKKRIILVDNYIDDTVLMILNKRKKDVMAVVYTRKITKQILLDLKKYNAQYPKIEIKEFTKSHDRFLIIDNSIYHIGASLKDLGRKWFAFSRLNKESLNILYKLPD